MGPVASPGVPLSRPAPLAVEQRGCWAKGEPRRAQCGGSAQGGGRGSGGARRGGGRMCGGGGGGAHLTNFRVLTRCSHCLPVRLGPRPISICSACPCGLGRSSARPATVYGAPRVGPRPHGAGGRAGHAPSRPPRSHGSRGGVSLGGGPTLQLWSELEGRSRTLAAASSGGRGTARAATRESVEQARRLARSISVRATATLSWGRKRRDKAS